MKIRTVRGVGFEVSSAFSALGAARQVSRARQERDRLLLANAFANALVVVTALALAIRAFRNKGAT